MTLDDVMKLEGRELNEAVALKLQYASTNRGHWRKANDGSWEQVVEIPNFAVAWSAATVVRVWSRKHFPDDEYEFAGHVVDCLSRRIGWKATVCDVAEWIEAIDYARAALLIGESS